MVLHGHSLTSRIQPSSLDLTLKYLPASSLPYVPWPLISVVNLFQISCPNRGVGYSMWGTLLPPLPMPTARSVRSLEELISSDVICTSNCTGSSVVPSKGDSQPSVQVTGWWKTRNFWVWRLVLILLCLQCYLLGESYSFASLLTLKRQRPRGCLLHICLCFMF